MLMPFPVSSCGTISEYRTDLTAAIASVREMIHDEEAAIFSPAGDSIQFASAMACGISKSWVLGVMDSGTVSFRQIDGRTDACYCISFRRALMHVTSLVLVFGLVLIVVFGWHPASLLFVCGAWIFLFGANFLSATFRFRGALRRALAKSRLESSTDAMLHI